MNLNFSLNRHSSADGRKEAGFSLLEVLIALAVLVFISMGIYQATSQTYRLRDVLMNEGDFYNGIRMAMDIVQRDVTMIYSPTLTAPPKSETATATGGPTAPPPGDPAAAQEMLNLLSTELGQTTDFWLPAIDKSGIRPSRFIGTDSKMSFISLSHLRVYRDAPESEFAKISYELRKDEGNIVAPDALLLVKTENPNAFDVEDRKDAKQIRTYPLLHGITKFKYRYYHKGKDQWYNSWDSDKEEFKNAYPDMIEVTLGVVGPSRLSFEGQYQFRPEVPLRGLDPSS